MHLASKQQELLDVFYTFAPENPEMLQAVYERITDGCRELLVLQFTTKSLFFTANPDDDTIGVHCENGALPNPSTCARIDSAEPWRSLIGSTFGWGWITINHQGYCDGILLSFEGIVPNLMLGVIASSITVRRILSEEKEARALSGEKNGA